MNSECYGALQEAAVLSAQKIVTGGELKNEVRQMQIDVRIDGNIEGAEGLLEHVQALVGNALSRFSDRVTVVEVRLSDVNGKKGGPADKGCMMEVRLEGAQPTAVTDHGSTFEQAIKGWYPSGEGRLVRRREAG